MPEETTMDDVLDSVDKAGADISRALRDIKPNVTVHVPAQPPPNVTVQPAQVNVVVPKADPPTLKVEAYKPVGWMFEITKRDMNGRVEAFTATPKP